jgi:anti-anti-sigma factor
MAEPFKAQVRQATTYVIDLTGLMDKFAEEEVMHAYEKVSERGAKHILLNFAGVHEVSSAGLAILIALLNETQERDQQMGLFNVNTHLNQLFEMIGLLDYVSIYETEEQAQASVA